MNQYPDGLCDNAYDLPAQSRIEINLCFRGSRLDEAHPMREANPADAHSIRTPLWLQPGPWLDQCTAATPTLLVDDDDMPEGVRRLLRTHHQNIMCGSMESEEPVQDPLEHQPTFSFEPPGAYQNYQNNQPQRHDSVTSVEVKPEHDTEQYVPSQPLRVSRARRSPRAEYNEATRKDFQQHLGVIDLRDELVAWPYTSGNMTPYQANLGDIQYRKQLMLLEQENMRRLQRADHGKRS